MIADAVALSVKQIANVFERETEQYKQIHNVCITDVPLNRA